MPKLIDSITTISWTLLIGLNIFGALPRLYKGRYRNVTQPDVRVFRNMVGEGQKTVPIEEWPPSLNPPTDNGQTVVIWLSNSYKDDQSYFFPWVTLSLLFVLNRCKKYKEKSKSEVIPHA